jgi:hypothetical protein
MGGDDQADPSDLYSAEFIVDKKRGTYKGKKMTLYRVRWTGYTEADDTWEPIENLNDALLSDFEESLKQRRPRQQQSPSRDEAPSVTWSHMLAMLGSCPLERLPNCLHPHLPAVAQPSRPPEPKSKDTHAGPGNHLTILHFFRTHNHSSNGLNQQYSAAETYSAHQAQTICPPANSGVAHAAFVQNQPCGLSCASRPRSKKAAPSRSPLANVFMNC